MLNAHRSTALAQAHRLIALTHLYHALNKHSYFQWVTTFERCVWHYKRLLGDYTMVFWMPPGSGSTLKAS